MWLVIGLMFSSRWWDWLFVYCFTKVESVILSYFLMPSGCFGQKDVFLSDVFKRMQSAGRVIIPSISKPQARPVRMLTMAQIDERDQTCLHTGSSHK